MESDNKKQIIKEKELLKRNEQNKLNPKLNVKKSANELSEHLRSFTKWSEEWSIKKKEKLIKKQTELQNKYIGNCTFHPQININSKKLIEAQNKFLKP